MSRNVLYLKDILGSMDRIKQYTKGFDVESFSRNEMVVDAVVRNLEIMGEASGKIPIETREKYREVPWIELEASGKYLIDYYSEVDTFTVWDIILLLGHLRLAIVAVIEKEESEPM